MLETEYERGDYFSVENHPTVEGMVILETTDDLHGEPAYRVAEKDTEDDDIGWYQHWMPARYLHDELNVGAVKERSELDPVQVEKVDSIVTPQEPLQVKDVTPQFTDWNNV